MEDKTPERLVTLRETIKHGVPICVVSELIGLGTTSLGKYERGECKPGADAIKKIANFYHVTSDYILGIEEDNL